MTRIHVARAALAESRVSAEDPTVPLTGEQLLEFVYGSAATDAGVVVDERSSLKMSVV